MEPITSISNPGFIFAGMKEAGTLAAQVLDAARPNLSSYEAAHQ